MSFPAADSQGNSSGPTGANGEDRTSQSGLGRSGSSRNQAGTPSSIAVFQARNLRWNFFWGLLDGAFFGTYLVLIDVNLVIPWLLSQLTDLRWVIGLTPTIATVGSSLPQLFAARFVQREPFRRKYVVGFSVLRLLSLTAMLPLLFWPIAGQTATLVMVLVGFSLASFMVSFIALPWQDMIAKVIPARRLSSFFGLRSALGGVLGLGMAAFIRAYLGATGTVPLPKFGLIFTLGIVAIGLAALANVFIREPAGLVNLDRPPLPRQFRQAFLLSWHHRPYRHYLAMRSLLMMSSLTAPLFIVEGRGHYGLLAESIGTFTIAGLVAGIVASLFWSFLGDRLGLMRLLRVVALLSMAPALIALAMPAIAASTIGPFNGWLAVFCVLGAAITGQQNVNFRGMLELPPPEDRSLMIGVGNTFAGVVSLAGPLIGLLADLAGVQSAFAFSALATVTVVVLTGRLTSRPAPAI